MGFHDEEPMHNITCIHINPRHQSIFNAIPLDSIYICVRSLRIQSTFMSIHFGFNLHLVPFRLFAIYISINPLPFPFCTFHIQFIRLSSIQMNRPTLLRQPWGSFVCLVILIIGFNCNAAVAQNGRVTAAFGRATAAFGRATAAFR